MGGWATIGTMMDVYGKVSDDMVNKKKLIVNGIIKTEEQKKEDKFKPIICPRCQKDNPRNVDTCVNCWLPLTKKAIEETDKDMDLIFKNNELKDKLFEMFLQKYKEEIKQDAKLTR